MRTNTIAAIAIAILIVVAVAMAARSNVYLIDEGGGATVLWNANEADVFISIRHMGEEVNCLRYPWFVVKSYLGGVEDNDNDGGSLAVIRVTSSGIERHVLRINYEPPGSAPDMYTPLEGHIYANAPQLGGLCRWAGDHFQPASPEEQRRLGGIDHLTNQDIPNGNDGWFKRSFQAGPVDSDAEFTLAEGVTFRLSASDLTAKNGDRILSINLLRPGHASEKIWDVELRVGRVSKAEYQRIFTAISGQPEADAVH
jgi:hypothetical protein